MVCFSLINNNMLGTVRLFLYEICNEMEKTSPHKKKIIEAAQKLDNIIIKAKKDMSTKDHTHILIKLFQDV
jgi:hypothetical protein